MRTDKNKLATGSQRQDKQTGGQVQYDQHESVADNFGKKKERVLTY